MQTITTLSQQKPFRYKRTPEGEIIVYASDKAKQPQDREALVITAWTENLVGTAILGAGEIVIGPSRTEPPRGSLGSLLQEHGQSPQQLSYLCAVLVHEEFCKVAATGKGPMTLTKA